MTYTYVEMEVTPRTFREIRMKLRKAGYDHAIDENVLDMHGIALKLKRGMTLRERLTRGANHV